MNLPWWHVKSRKNIGPDQFSRFDVYWIQTNRETDKLSIHTYIDDLDIAKLMGRLEKKPYDVQTVINRLFEIKTL